MAEAKGLRAGLFIGGKGWFADEIFVAAHPVTQAPSYLAAHELKSKAVCNSVSLTVS